jgi:hypothetical protein
MTGSGPGPESILTMVVIDSGLSLREPRNDGAWQVSSHAPAAQSRSVLRCHSGMRRRDKIARLFFAKGAGPESTLTIVVIDSGLLTSSRPGNDVFPAAFLQAARGRVVIVFLTWFTDR